MKLMHDWGEWLMAMLRNGWAEADLHIKCIEVFGKTLYSNEISQGSD